MGEAGRLRIGELSRRVGLSPELLRAWETRYGVVRPERTSGGLRLYSEHDERRLRRMQERIADGLSASEAARLAKLEDPAAPAGTEDVPELADGLERSFEMLDEPAAQAALDRVFSVLQLRPALDEVILPFLQRVGERWAAAETSVAQEHFASSVIGGRLRALGRDWGEGEGPHAVLACPPGEQHELGLLCFGLALRAGGWRITYLGASTPLGDIARALGELSPAIVVLTAVTPQRFLDSAEQITALGAHARVALGGAGASNSLARKLRVEALEGGAVSAAAKLAP